MAWLRIIFIGRSRAADAHGCVVFCSRLDLQKKFIFNVLAFKSKLGTSIKSEIKVFSVWFCKYLRPFPFNNGQNVAFSSQTKMADLKSADVQARQPEWRQQSFSEFVAFSKSFLPFEIRLYTKNKESRLTKGNPWNLCNLILKKLVELRNRNKVSNLARKSSGKGRNLKKGLLKHLRLSSILIDDIKKAFCPNGANQSSNVTSIKAVRVVNVINLARICASVRKKMKPNPHPIEFLTLRSPNQQSLELWYEENIADINNILLIISGNVEKNPGPSTQTDDGPEQQTATDEEARYARGAGQQRASVKPTQVKAVTYNVRGLNDQNKVRHLINYFNKAYCSKDFDSVIALQETNIVKEGIIPYIWRGNYVLTPGTGNSKGCLTLLSSHVSVVEKLDIGERCHIIACQRSDSQLVNYIVANIYGPNKHDNEKVEFFEEIMDKLTELEIKHACHNVLLLGDLNIIFEEREKKNRLYTSNERRVGKIISSLFKDSNLKDIWEKKAEFTWRRPNTDTFSTLDRILYRSELLCPISIEADWSLGYSDHAAIKVSFANNVDKQKKKTTRLSRLDPSLLSDARTKEKIKDEF